MNVIFKIDIRDINSGEICCKENVELNNNLVSAFLSNLNSTTSASSLQQLTMVYYSGQGWKKFQTIFFKIVFSKIKEIYKKIILK